MSTHTARTPLRHAGRLLALAALLGTLAGAGPALGHALGEDYVFFNFYETKIEGEFQINTADLRDKLGVPMPKDPATANPDALTAILVGAAPEVERYVRENFTIGPVGGPPIELEFTTTGWVGEAGGFGKFSFEADTGPLPDQLAITHNMFYDGDRLHRGLVLVQYNDKTKTNYGAEHTALVFSPGNREQVLDLTDIPGLLRARQMIWQGVLHIWIGIDHILFLVALLLPTVLVLRDREWAPVEGIGKAFFTLLKIVTVFTVAHSITLGLAALDVIRLNSQFVESMIALSIVLVAINNITKTVRDGSLLVILVLGLFHGLGFATVMGHLPFRMVNILKTVIGFNIGVEVGQVVIVALLFPVLYLLRKQRFYVPVILHGGSIVLILIAGYWFVQRAFGLG